MNHQNRPERELSPYQKKLLDPRWQKKRLEIFQRDEWKCQVCRDSTSTLQVHHHYYNHAWEPWEYPGLALVTLCDLCHEMETTIRKQVELQLLETLKRFGVFSSDLIDLINALGLRKEIGEAMGEKDPAYEVFPHNAILPALTFCLTDTEAFVAMIERYMEHRTNRSAEQDTDE